MVRLEEIKKLVNENKRILEERYKIKTIGLFGSLSRGELQPKSDIDVLVEFYDTPDLFEFMRLEEYLGSLFGRKVDLVSKKALKPIIKEEILKETVYL
jgi:hypothetical protein